MKIMPPIRLFAGAISILLVSATHVAAGDAKSGAEIFPVCAACHSLTPDRHMSGPSLAGIWGKKAGSVNGFARYSAALQSANFVWDEGTFDAWLADPETLVPGNQMTFGGITDPKTRADLIAFLKLATSDESRTAQTTPSTREAQLLDLRTLGPDRQVTAIRYCGDTYEVKTATGLAIQYWEFNLRFKTDSSDIGPLPGNPVLLPASMRGDRGFVIFSNPSEISVFIEQRC